MIKLRFIINVLDISRLGIVLNIRKENLKYTNLKELKK
jgi:hypothetical protein